MRVRKANGEKHSKCFDLTLLVVGSKKTFGDFNRQIELCELVEGLLNMFGRRCSPAGRVGIVGRYHVSLAADAADGNTHCKKVFNLSYIIVGVETFLHKDAIIVD